MQSSARDMKTYISAPFPASRPDVHKRVGVKGGPTLKHLLPAHHTAILRRKYRYNPLCVVVFQLLHVAAPSSCFHKTKHLGIARPAVMWNLVSAHHEQV